MEMIEKPMESTRVKSSTARMEETEVAFGHRLKVLDGVRGLAVLMVVMFHSMPLSSSHWADRAFSLIRAELWSGVDLFFVLSGYLITGILLDSRDKPNYFKNFYGRRALRIFPLYYAVLVVVLFGGAYVIALFDSGSIPFRIFHDRLLDNQIYLWTYTNNFLQSQGQHSLPGFGHFWTLAIEEQFYLLWPLAVFAVPRKHFLAFALSLAAFSALLRGGLTLYGVDGRVVQFMLPTHADGLLFGAIASFMMREKRWHDWLKQMWKYILIGAGLLLFVLGIARNGLSPEDPWTLCIGYVLLAAFFTALIVGVVHARPESNLAGMFNLKCLRAIGKYSYAIYIFHWPIAVAVRVIVKPFALYPAVLPSRLFDQVLTFIIVLSISYVLALVSWHLWEKHWLRQKKYFSYQDH